MEMGTFGIDVAMFGYPNGATLAYSLYLFAFLVSYKFKNKTIKRNIDKTIELNRYEQNIAVKKFKLSIFVLLFFLFTMLFLFGGINVIFGNVTKGDFRISFGIFGAIPFFITKLFAPALLAYLTNYYILLKKKLPKIKKLFIINVILCFIIGATWGFKSTAIMILLPTAIIFWKKISLRKLFIVSSVSILIFTAFAVFYDNRNFKLNDVKTTITDFSIEETFDITKLNAFSAILYRLTVVQGNSAWRIWDLYKSGETMPNYWETFLSIFGDKFLAWSDISRSNKSEFIRYHFSAATTDLIKKSAAHEGFKHNVTATAFSDGVIMGGTLGVFLIGLLAGYISKIIKRKIILYHLTHNYIHLSIVVVFFSSYFRSWLNSGGFSSLIHISLFIGLGLTFLFLKTFDSISKSRL